MSVALEQIARLGSDIEIEEVTTSAGLTALEPLWDALVTQARFTHPFVTHLWMRTFWSAFGSSSRLMVLVVRRAGRAIAIAPLARRTRTMLGMSYRVIETIRNPHSPRSDLIFTDHPSDAARAILEYLVLRDVEWDMLELAHLPVASTALTKMQRAARHLSLRTGLRDLGGSPHIVLPSRWDTLQRTIPARYRSSLRNRKRRLARIGSVRLESVTAPSAADFDDFFRLETSAWKRDAGTAIASDAATSQFYRALAVRASERGWLRLQFLAVGERRIAASYTLLYDNRIHVLKSGYDPDFAVYSPGNLLCELALEQAIEEGRREYDFLGDADPWKLAWTSVVRPHRWLSVFPDSFRGRWLHRAKFGALARLRPGGAPGPAPHPPEAS